MIDWTPFELSIENVQYLAQNETFCIETIHDRVAMSHYRLVKKSVGTVYTFTMYLYIYSKDKS